MKADRFIPLRLVHREESQKIGSNVRVEDLLMSKHEAAHLIGPFQLVIAVLLEDNGNNLA